MSAATNIKEATGFAMKFGGQAGKAAATFRKPSPKFGSLRLFEAPTTFIAIKEER